MRFLKRARADIEDIYAHLVATEDVHKARAVVACIKDVAELIAGNPGLGRLASRRGVRVVPAVPYPYLICYRNGRGVLILRILHASDRLPRLQEPAPPFRR